MRKLLSTIFKKSKEVHEAIFTEVETSAEFNVEETINTAIKTAVQQATDECSKKYYRTIHVDFKTNIK